MNKTECKYCKRLMSDDIINIDEETEFSIDDWDEEHGCCVDCLAEGRPFE